MLLGQIFIYFLKEINEEALQKLRSTIVTAYETNKRIKFEVFIHKVDEVNQDYRLGDCSYLHFLLVQSALSVGCFTTNCYHYYFCGINFFCCSSFVADDFVVVFVVVLC